MKNTGYEKYLSKYYKREVRLFLSHLNKAEALPNEKNIHQLRVDIKRMKAVFSLLEILFPKKFKAEKYYTLLKSVFKNAGKIREMQVNRSCLARYKLSLFIVKEYRQFSKRKEIKFKKKFKKTINRFDAGLPHTSIIKKLFAKVSNTRIIDSCRLFIKIEAQKTKQLLAAGDTPTVIHEIRMHLKSLSAVVSLFSKIKPNKELKKLQPLIKQSGTLIGDWHDKIILIKSLESFLTKNKNIKGRRLFSLTVLLNKIKKRDQLFFKSLKSKLLNISDKLSRID